MILDVLHRVSQKDATMCTTSIAKLLNILEKTENQNKSFYIKT